MQKLFPLDDRQSAIVALGRALRDVGYVFVTPTPETHRRVLARGRPATSLRDVFGWSRPFAPGVLPPHIHAWAERAGVLVPEGAALRANVRFSTLGERLFAHSPHPTEAPDAVFFGPDTYRFCAFIERAGLDAKRVVDIGCGSGAGGLVAASAAAELVLADVNPAALRLAAVNAALNDRAVVLAQSDVLAGVEGDFDLILANPPYLVDAEARTYRNGGGALGAELSLRIVRESLPRLRSGGTLLLYTGVAILAGEDPFRAHLTPLLEDFDSHYEELDPDVFGEELDTPAYGDAERIAVVALRATRR